MKERRKAVTITIDAEVLAKGQAAAGYENRTLSNFIETLIVRYCREKEKTK